MLTAKENTLLSGEQSKDTSQNGKKPERDLSRKESLMDPVVIGVAIVAVVVVIGIIVFVRKRNKK